MTRTTLYPTFALIVVALAAGYALGHRGDATTHLLERQSAALDAMLAHSRGLAARADSLRSEADSLGHVAGASMDTAVVYLTRWRERVDTVDAAVDTAAIVAAFPGLVAAGDSLAEACDTAVSDCRAALQAKDRALVATDSVLASERERAAALEGYRDELADRLRRRERWRTVRDAGFMAGGMLMGALACVVVGCGS